MKKRIGNKNIFNYIGHLAKLSVLLVIFLFSNKLIAQSEIHATAKLDSTKMRLGEQAHLHLTVSVPSDAQVTFPAIPDSIHKLEIVQRSKIDTTKSANGKFATYHQSLTVTGFDSGYFVIEPMTFFYQKKGSINKDSVSTEAMLIQVQTVPVDTTKEIKDIKPPVDVPFTFREAIPYILGGLAIIAAIIIISRYLKNRKRKPVEVKRKIPSRPAHEIALEELRKIEAQKLWQQGFYKLYQSAVADTIRAYIEHRFAIPALELPSDETLEHFKRNHITPEAFEKLRQIFMLADMVKFAKAIPVGSENELSMQQAIDFVMLTKPVAQKDFVGTGLTPALDAETTDNSGAWVNPAPTVTNQEGAS